VSHAAAAVKIATDKADMKHGYLPVILLLLLLMGCQEHALYHQSRSISPYGWHTADTLYYDIPIGRAALASTVDVFLELRNTLQYPYRDVPLVVESQFIPLRAKPRKPQTKYIRYLLTDEIGHWTGAGWGSSYQHAVPIERYRITRQGTLRLKVYHRMKRAMLPGIENIGVRVETPKQP
jgi:gliding motility-associated lipoprotein GldH